MLDDIGIAAIRLAAFTAARDVNYSFPHKHIAYAALIAIQKMADDASYNISADEDRAHLIWIHAYVDKIIDDMDKK